MLGPIRERWRWPVIYRGRLEDPQEVFIVGAILEAAADRIPASIRPVEYAVAVDRYLAGAVLSDSSRRVYKISLTGWCWPLVGERLPTGRLRRGAAPPVVPLALLDDRAAASRIAAAVNDRRELAGSRTLNRELSALRSAIGWWQDRGWISTDPTAGLRYLGRLAAPRPALRADQLDTLWRSAASLREHAFWRLLSDSGAPAHAVLALDADQLDLAASRTKVGAPPTGQMTWTALTSDLLDWLLAGRRRGPVFLADRRATGSQAPGDVCQLTGRARLSYRRAVEIFTAHTVGLDPASRGWMLHQLRSPAEREPRSAQ
jgi:hypothetical protein